MADDKKNKDVKREYEPNKPNVPDVPNNPGVEDNDEVRKERWGQSSKDRDDERYGHSTGKVKPDGTPEE